jgi:hypothetical protein
MPAPQAGALTLAAAITTAGSWMRQSCSSVVSSHLGIANEGGAAAAQHGGEAGRRRHAGGAAGALVPRRCGEAARGVAGLTRPHLAQQAHDFDQTNQPHPPWHLA